MGLGFSAACVSTHADTAGTYVSASSSEPNTAHTTNLVRMIYVADDASGFRVETGILADVAPTLLFLLGVPRPTEMTGQNLLVPEGEPKQKG